MNDEKIVGNVFQHLSAKPFVVVFHLANKRPKTVYFFISLFGRLLLPCVAGCFFCCREFGRLACAGPNRKGFVPSAQTEENNKRHSAARLM